MRRLRLLEDKKAKLNEKGRMFITGVLLIIIIFVMFKICPAEPSREDGTHFKFDKQMGCYVER